MTTTIWEHFSIVPDPCVDRTKLHRLQDILNNPAPVGHWQEASLA
jgi:hypothetical protein